VTESLKSETKVSEERVPRDERIHLASDNERLSRSDNERLSRSDNARLNGSVRRPLTRRYAA